MKFHDTRSEAAFGDAPAVIRTERLELIAMTLATIEAELGEPTALAQVLGVEVPADWPPGEFDRDAMLYFRELLRVAPSERIGWFGWYAFRTGPAGKRETLVGAVGYFGPPVAGTVEIGFSVLAQERNRGYATECARALVERAFSFPQVMRVIARTTDKNAASARVLTGAGFQCMGPAAEAGMVQYHCDRRPPASN